jgi:hypothetical protein
MIINNLLILLISAATVVALLPANDIFKETEEIFVDAADTAAAAAVAVAKSILFKARRLLLSVVMLVPRAAELIAKLFLEFVSVVFKLATVFKLVRISLGSNTLTPMIGNSTEYFLVASDAVNIAGLKNGAVEGSSTATPVLPMAIERGSNELNGIDRAAPHISIKATAKKLRPI